MLSISEAKSKLGVYKGAISDFNKAIKLDAKDTTPYLNKGLTKNKCGKLDEACLDWSKAVELGQVDAYELIKKYCNK